MAKRRRGFSEDTLLLLVLLLIGLSSLAAAMVLSVVVTVAVMGKPVTAVLGVVTEPTVTPTATRGPGTPTPPPPTITPPLTETPTAIPTAAPRVFLEVVKTVDGDGDGTFNENETAPSGSIATVAFFPVIVIFRVVIDNDSTLPVIIVSLNDDIYPGVVCRDSSGGDVVGQTLAADDGDGVDFQNMGDDEIICAFPEAAPADNTPVTDLVAVCVTGANTSVCEQDDATIRTLDTPTPTPTPMPTITPTPTPIG